MKEIQYGLVIPLELKAESDKGQFEGYMSTFKTDVQGDRIVPGAFAATIAEKKSFPILQFHNQELLSGFTTYIAEDAKGVFFEAQLNLDTSMGRDAWGMLKGAKSAGFPMGMSIGFIPGKTSWDDNAGIRLIEDLELYEGSITPWPANRGARVGDLKSAQQIRTFERLLRDVGGCSVEGAKRVVAFASLLSLPIVGGDSPLTPGRDGRDVETRNNASTALAAVARQFGGV